jgi:hypothetical protein
MTIDRGTLGFPESVEREFGFLKAIGFALRLRDATLVCFESDRVRIDVYQGRQSYGIGLTIEQVGGPADERYSIGTLLKLLDPELGRTYRDFAALTPEAVERGVTRLSGFFRRCVADGLLEDPRLFDRLRTLTETLVERHVEEMELADIRRRLEQAWKAKNYAQVLALLTPVERLLSPSELEKLKYARKRATSG